MAAHPVNHIERLPPWGNVGRNGVGDRRRRGSEWVCDRLMVLFANGGCCVYCGRESETVDHVIPWARRGYDGTDNMVPACKTCNQSKSDRTPAEFVMARSHPRVWPSPGKPTGPVSLMRLYEEADKECRRTLALIGDVLVEVADEARKQWFVEQFVGLGTIQSQGLEMVDCTRAFFSSAVERAAEAGWPKRDGKQPQCGLAARR
ncbi:HNH endonuclease [Streptomyces sp. NPDC020802]|uniref:HNH endonuclease n=1 Tax=Streptomyces sp. NPDC020802 TaxID=3365094 RepID=UPI0037A00D59